jgi:hypothetical protein
MTTAQALKRISLNRSLDRLGQSVKRGSVMPDVFIENELAFACRRFGVSKIARAVVRQTCQDMKMSLYCKLGWRL